jgi:5-methylthioadenosine/S-adenosylhomocysteine deaminase
VSQTVLYGGLVLPLDGSGSWFAPGVVCFEGARISYVGPAYSAPAPHEDALTFDCRDHLILPGLVNTHTHSGMTYFRNLLEDLPSANWFRYELQAEQLMRREDVYWAALLGAYEMLRQGITTIADRFSHMDVVVEALAHAGIRAVVAPSLIDRDAELRKQQALTLLEQYGVDGDGLIHVGLGPVGPDTCSTELLRWTREQADHTGALIFIHLAQSRQELAEIRRRGHDGAARYLDAIGLLGPDVVAAHCIYLDEEEIVLLGARGVRVAHCPASNAKIEGRVAPVLALEGAGALIGLGTDCAASNNGMDLFSEMKTAGLLHKVATCDPEVMNVRRLLSLATVEAAACLNLEGRVGSLVAGKEADVMTLQRDALHLQPWHDPHAGLVYAARGSDVRDVWVAGQQHVRDGQLLAADAGEALERAAAWAERHRPALRQQRSSKRG